MLNKYIFSGCVVVWLLSCVVVLWLSRCVRTFLSPLAIVTPTHGRLNLHLYG